MHVTIKVTAAELAQMQTTPEQLQTSVANALESGLEDEEGSIYLSGLDVEVQVSN